MAHGVGNEALTSHFRSTSRSPGPMSQNRPGLNGRGTVEDAEYSLKIQDFAPRVWITFAVLGLLALAYLFSLIVRTPDQSWTWLDGWGVAIFEALASILCIIRGLDKHPGRAAPLALGLGLLCWSLGDAFLTIESLGGATPSVPSIADVLYLGFYPLAYVATVQLLRNAMGRLSRPNWLDGVVAGLGAAAICATFRRQSIWPIPLGTSCCSPSSLVARSCCRVAGLCRGSSSHRALPSMLLATPPISSSHRRSSQRVSALMSTHSPGRRRSSSWPCRCG